MNPDTVIRPWLVTVGSTFGNTEAHDYTWPDAPTRPTCAYFTYQLLSMQEGEPRARKLYGRTGDTLNRVAEDTYITTVQVDLYRSQNGLAELAQCCIAAKDENINLKRFFNSDGCDFKRVVSIENLTEIQQDEHGLSENYHQRMIVEFYDNLRVEFDENNEVVDEIIVTL